MGIEARPKIHGPLSNGRGWPFSCPVDDVTERGYVMEEFLLEGQATSFRVPKGGVADRDGLWEVEPAETAPYVTRAYVVRPDDPARFNGVAVVNWQNVTAGFDLGAPLDGEIYRGYAWVGVTTQKIGVDGAAGLLPGMPSTKGLLEWDPERYGALKHPGDAWSYDIFTQAGRAVRAGTELMGGLKPSLVLASGESQSAMRLGSYLNAAHQGARVYDGFHLTVHWGICPPLDEMDLMSMFGPEGAELPSPATCAIRDDGGVPILSVATECEARFNLPVRQAETDTFRFWEVAGASHESRTEADAFAAIMARDEVTLSLPQPTDPNVIEWGFVNNAALRALVSWCRHGKVPASHPRIEFEGDQARRDEFGNAKGGIRVPELTAPVASYLGERDEGMETWLLGKTTPLAADRLARLYPEAGDRERAWNRAVDALVEQRLVVAEDVEGLRARRSVISGARL
jgi:hypothetical protein|tara:strand:- start:18 stop:1388 length:1371 start_codon:yes stop_codon:yes gene_type:complete